MRWLLIFIHIAFALSTVPLTASTLQVKDILHFTGSGIAAGEHTLLSNVYQEY